MPYGDPMIRTMGSRHRHVLAAAATTAVLAAFASGLPASADPATSTPPAASAATRSSAAEAADPGLARFYAQSLTWQPCQRGLTCAWLTVPLDYAAPDGDTIAIRVSKVVATGSPADRIGSLVVNPGGPGASGLDLASYVADSVGDAVSSRFDIVGFDTRGVGQSAPITCLTGRQTTQWLRTDQTPDTIAEQRRYLALAGRIAAGCLGMSPRLARHVGSENTVRDLDVLRGALGDDRLNWLGYSYGTYLGAHYAQQFPDRVGRFVLDGAVDPSLTMMQTSKGQSAGFQVAITRFARDCASRSLCPWGRSTRSVLAGLNRLLDGLDARPMRANRGRPLTQAEALSAVFFSLYSPSMWLNLRLALSSAADGDGRGLQTLADFSSERIGPNRYGSNMASAFPAIGCWDTTAPPGRTGLAAAARAWSRGAAVPQLAQAMAWGSAPCTTWYGHSPLVPGPVTSTTPSAILVIGTRYDPATPYAWSRTLAASLPTATLLTFDGDGHTAYLGDSRCIDAAVNAYLVTGTPPPSGTVCR